MRVGVPGLVLIGILLLVALPALTSASGNGGHTTASYLAAGAGVITFVDTLTGDFHGAFAGVDPVTIVPNTPFNIVGAIANDASSPRPPIAICVGDTACAPAQSFGIIGLRTVSARSVVAWPAGTPVTFYPLSAAMDKNHVPAYATSGTLMISWS